MRVDRFTESFSLSEKNYLVNFKTNAMDEISEFIAKKVEALRRGASFTTEECGITEPLIEYLIKRGHFTIYSDQEEEAERKSLFEKKKEEAKKEEKTVSVVMDSLVGDNWCFPGKKIKNQPMNRNGIEYILGTIGSKNISKEVNLWLLIIRRISEWDWIEKTARDNNLRIKALYTVVNGESDFVIIEDWFKNKKFFYPVTMNIKIINNKMSYISISKTEKGGLEKSEDVLFHKNHPFFCPFLYGTFFINRDGDMDYCMQRLDKNKSAGRIFPVIRVNKGWDKELFSHFCEPDRARDCSSSIFCSKKCEYLKDLYINTKNDKTECKVALCIRAIVREKIAKTE